MSRIDSAQVRSCVSSLVDWYAERASNGLLTLDVPNIPESDINNLAGLILAQDTMLAGESTSADNPDWEKSMLPALIRSMRSQKTGYTTEEFHDIWTAGVRNYLMPYMNRMIEECLQDLNGDRECLMEQVYDRATEKVIEIRSRM